MHFLDVQDGEKIFYRDMGSGDPVILIHGWPVNSDMWEYQIPSLLKAGYRVITYDRRGFGRSSHPAKSYNYDVFATDLKELINHLELQQVALVGFSMGGGEIARYLKLFGPERISKAVLMASVLPYRYKTESNPDGSMDEAAIAKRLEALSSDRPKFLTAFAKQFYGEGLLKDTVSDEILQWTWSMALMASPLATMECIKAFGKTDFRSDLSSFKMPTLIMHGSADKTVPIESSAEKTAKLIPHAQFIIYEGAPHGLFVTHKEEVTEDLIAFLDHGMVRRKVLPSEPVVPPPGLI